MRRSKWLVLVVMVLTGWAHGDSVTVIGNGRLTVALDSEGTVRSISWPHPGLWEQLGTQLMRFEAPQKIFAIERLSPTALRMTGAPATGGEGWSVRVEIADAVDALLLTQESEGAPAWMVDFSPMAHGIPGVPNSKSLFPGLGDFAAYRDGDTTIQFRPSELSSREVERARNLIGDSNWDPGAWGKLGDGVWIATDGTTALRDLDAGADSQPITAAAWGDYGWRLQPPADRSGLVIAFGDTPTSALEILRSAANAEAQAPRKLRLPRNADLQDIAKQALFTLLATQDRESGCIPAMVWAPDGRALDWPRDGAAVTLALDTAGFRGKALSHLNFYGRAVQQTSTPSAPFGSLPEAIQADGAPGLPEFIHSVDAAAAYLWTLHAMKARGADVSAESLAAGERAMAFLTEWAHPITRLPLAGYTPSLGRDDSNDAQLPVLFAGLNAGMTLYTDAHPEGARWRRRWTEIDALVRRRCLDDGGIYRDETPLAFGRELLVGVEARQAWAHSIADEGAAGTVMPLESLFAAAQILGSDPGLVSAATTQLNQDRQAALLGDTRAAALIYLTVMALDEPR